MALATRCPACSTVFRISTAQATAKGGTVRCGQCRHVFDSLDALVRVEDLEVLEEVQVAPQPASVDDVRPTPLPAAASEVGSGMFPDGEAVTVVVGPSDERRPDASVPEAGVEEPPADDRLGGEWWLPDPADSAARPPVSASSLADPTFPGSPATDHGIHAGRLQAGREDDAPDRLATGIGAGAEPAFLAVEPSSRASRTARWALRLGSLVAVLVLVGQLAYLGRDEIAARWTPSRPWLTAACVPLHCTVGYPAHLEWITIESATIQATGASLDVYVLSALLRNRASADVRYPHLELVLTDLQDRPILRRALRPEDYLPAGGAAGRNAAGRVDDAAQTGFAADSELPIHLTFELGDVRFAGYRVDKFYP